jgi:transcriptional regulator with XRE-family HTH domain
LETVDAFALAIRHLRKEKKLSQEKFAAICGIHTTHLSRIERSVREPSLTIIYRIADGCGITASELFKIVDEFRKQE